MRIYGDVVIAVVEAQVQGTYTRAKDMRTWGLHPSEMLAVTSPSQDEQREMLTMRSRMEVVDPVPVGCLRSLSREGGRFRFTFMMLPAPAWIWDKLYTSCTAQRDERALLTHCLSSLPCRALRVRLSIAG